jgi:hypothetical protein
MASISDLTLWGGEAIAGVISELAWSPNSDRILTLRLEGRNVPAGLLTPLSLGSNFNRLNTLDLRTCDIDTPPDLPAHITVLRPQGSF